MYLLGTSKKDITCNEEGIGMMGYGKETQIVKGLETPLMVRTFIIKDSDSDKKLIWVIPEILSATNLIKRGVIDILNKDFSHLNICDEELMISATHTHSGPGGYFDSCIYNMTISGYVPKVYNAIVKGIVESIFEAANKLEPTNIYLNNSDFDKTLKVAFNRSIKAYNKNPEVKKKLKYKERHLAVNRQMRLLKFVSNEGKAQASLNWFGVHTTSVGNDLCKICADNKGYAADELESWAYEKFDNKEYIGAFAQEACGDISPNFVWDKKRNRMRGGDKDDYLNAKTNGKIQKDKAIEIHESMGPINMLEGSIDSELIYVDMTKVFVNEEFSQGKANCRTGPAAMGLAFFLGATDGLGIPKSLKPIIKTAISSVKLKERFSSMFNKERRERINLKYDVHGKKDVFMETSEGRILGSDNMKKMLRTPMDPTTVFMKRQYLKGGIDEKPWTPDIVPIQICIIGKLAILAMPSEITTIAADRLRQTVLNVLKKRGVSEIIVSSYSNCYSGYVTTYEEYQEQDYEGGHTLFGKWTLAAYQTVFRSVAEEMLKPKNSRTLDRETKPYIYKEATIKGRTYGNF
jgi:neutral ceramidase